MILLNLKYSDIKQALEKKENPMITFTREDVLKMLKAHGVISFNQQTAAFKGEWVKEGSSFDELVGVKEAYTLPEIKGFLGY